MPTSGYTVSIESFEGPFDLLLQLIARRKLDVWDVPLAQITEDYLAVLRQWAELDLEVTTEFLVIAATLMELKAARLLPDEEDPDADEAAVEARDLLYARLLDYRTFKYAAGWLNERLSDHVAYVPRAVGPEAAFRDLRPPLELGIGPQRLADLAAGAFAAAAEADEPVDISYLQPVRLTVREAAGMVIDELARAGGQATFAELTAGCRHRVEVIVHFLSLLELYKLELVDLLQPTGFGTLRVRWELDVPPSQSALAAAELAERATDAWTADAPLDEPVPASDAESGSEPAADSPAGPAAPSPAGAAPPAPEGDEDTEEDVDAEADPEIDVPLPDLSGLWPDEGPAEERRD